MWNSSPYCCPPPVRSRGDLPLLFTACVLPSIAGQLIDMNLVIFVPLVHYAEGLSCWSPAVVDEVFLLSYLVTCMPVLAWVSVSGMVQSSLYVSLKGAFLSAVVGVCCIQYQPLDQGCVRSWWVGAEPYCFCFQLTYHRASSPTPLKSCKQGRFRRVSVWRPIRNPDPTVVTETCEVPVSSF